NLNRQLLATEGNLGTNKAAAAASRVACVNPDVTVEPVPRMLDDGNAALLLTGVDVVVDALDNIGGRLLLGRVARELGIPLVHGAIAGFTGQVATVLPGDPGLEKIYTRAAGASRGIETILGNPAATPAIAAALQVQEVVKLLTGVGEPLSRRLLYFDTELNLFEILTIG
ncbi:MAG TPA: ThiF family adenylyltransferase, partial [Negativicutes bacterium]|nr:ThiF family adenylyltransferase [Negativicutes bacterium]